MLARKVKFRKEYNVELCRYVIYLDCFCRQNEARCGDWCPCCQLTYPASISATEPTGVRVLCGQPLEYEGELQENAD